MTKRIFNAFMAFVLAIGIFVITSTPILPLNDYALIVEAKENTSEPFKTKITLNTGETFRLTIKDSSKKAKYRSDNNNIATVYNNGVISAKKSGTAKITAKVGISSQKFDVTVANMPTIMRSSNTAEGTSEVSSIYSAKNAIWKFDSGIKTELVNDS